MFRYVPLCSTHGMRWNAMELVCAGMRWYTQQEGGEIEMARLPAGWQDRFLEALRKGHTVSFAARLAGVGRRTVYRYREKSPKFSEAWGDALQEGLDNLLEECYRRALDPSDKASAQLLMFLVRCRIRLMGNILYPDEEIVIVDDSD